MTLRAYKTETINVSQEGELAKLRRDRDALLAQLKDIEKEIGCRGDGEKTPPRDYQTRTGEYGKLTATDIEIIDEILERHKTDVFDSEGAADDVAAFLWGAIPAPSAPEPAAKRLLADDDDQLNTAASTFGAKERAKALLHAISVDSFADHKVQQIESELRRVAAEEAEWWHRNCPNCQQGTYCNGAERIAALNPPTKGEK